MRRSEQRDAEGNAVDCFLLAAARCGEERMRFQNAYFITGTAYAGKSTMVRLLSEKYDGVFCGENYHDVLLPELDRDEFPGLTYTRDLQDWHAFIRRTPEEYTAWLERTARECEILEMQILTDLATREPDRRIFVDTNICPETLHQVAEEGHVLIMLSDPEVSVNRFFDRPDAEKQFLYRLMLEEPDPQAALDNFREMLRRVNSRENYERPANSGFPVLLRDERRSLAETLALVERVFGLAQES